MVDRLRCYLGAVLNTLSEGNAELLLQIKPEFKQNHGYVHGGVLSYLADNCLTFSAASVFGNCVTSEFKINYVRPAIGEFLVARATVISFGKRQAVCECKIYSVENGIEKLVAFSVGTIVKSEN